MSTIASWATSRQRRELIALRPDNASSLPDFDPAKILPQMIW
jgi:hypothetical protein